MTNVIELTHQPINDDIDRIVAALIADPARADDMKALLRQKLSASHRPTEAGVDRGGAHDSRDVEDMWDNLPV